MEALVQSSRQVLHSESISHFLAYVYVSLANLQVFGSELARY